MFWEALIVLWAVLLVWFAFSCRRAPAGYEDAAGFHLGSEPEVARERLAAVAPHSGDAAAARPRSLSRRSPHGEMRALGR